MRKIRNILIIVVLIPITLVGSAYLIKFFYRPEYKVYTVPLLNIAFDLPSKLDYCGKFIIDFERGSFSGRTISSNFDKFECDNAFELNSLSVNDYSKMKTLDIFRNIQGYTVRNETYYYLRYIDGRTIETAIRPVSQPQEIESSSGMKMLKVFGVGQITQNSTTEIGGLPEDRYGYIIPTGHDGYPALTLTINKNEINLNDEDINRILSSFRRNK